MESVNVGESLVRYLLLAVNHQRVLKQPDPRLNVKT